MISYEASSLVVLKSVWPAYTSKLVSAASMCIHAFPRMSFLMHLGDLMALQIMNERGQEPEILNSHFRFFDFPTYSAVRTYKGLQQHAILLAQMQILSLALRAEAF